MRPDRLDRCATSASALRLPCITWLLTSLPVFPASPAPPAPLDPPAPPVPPATSAPPVPPAPPAPLTWSSLAGLPPTSEPAVRPTPPLRLALLAQSAPPAPLANAVPPTSRASPTPTGPPAPQAPPAPSATFTLPAPPSSPVPPTPPAQPVPPAPPAPPNLPLLDAPPAPTAAAGDGPVRAPALRAFQPARGAAPWHPSALVPTTGALCGTQRWSKCVVLGGARTGRQGEWVADLERCTSTHFPKTPAILSPRGILLLAAFSPPPASDAWLRAPPRRLFAAPLLHCCCCTGPPCRSRLSRSRQRCLSRVATVAPIVQSGRCGESPRGRGSCRLRGGSVAKGRQSGLRRAARKTCRCNLRRFSWLSLRRCAWRWRGAADSRWWWRWWRASSDGRRRAARCAAPVSLPASYKPSIIGMRSSSWHYLWLPRTRRGSSSPQQRTAHRRGGRLCPVSPRPAGRCGWRRRTDTPGGFAAHRSRSCEKKSRKTTSLIVYFATRQQSWSGEPRAPHRCLQYVRRAGELQVATPPHAKRQHAGRAQGYPSA